MRRQPPFLDDRMFRIMVLLLLAGIFWALVTDYHFQMPQDEEEPSPLTAQEKAIYVWVLYILAMMTAWSLFFLRYEERIRDSLRDFRKRREEKKRQSKEASR